MLSTSIGSICEKLRVRIEKQGVASKVDHGQRISLARMLSGGVL